MWTFQLQLHFLVGVLNPLLLFNRKFQQITNQQIHPLNHHPDSLPNFPYPSLPSLSKRNPSPPGSPSYTDQEPNCPWASVFPGGKNPKDPKSLDGRIFLGLPFWGATPNDALNWKRFLGVGVTIFGGYLIYSLNFMGGVIEIAIFCYRNITTNGL